MKNGILTASFGTTYKEARRLSLEAIDQSVLYKFPGFAVYKAYTSSIVKRRIYENEEILIPGISQALNKMFEDGIENAYIMPTHIIPGTEYHKILDTARMYNDKFNILKISEPLLSSASDFSLTADILNRHYNLNGMESNSAVVFMGHGSEHAANKCYSQFQDTLNQKGFFNVFVSTVEGTPDFETSLSILRKQTFKNITLIPFMVTAGDHAHNDMAGSKEDSWKNQLKALGYNIKIITHGLGELKEIQELYLSHLNNVINNTL